MSKEWWTRKRYGVADIVMVIVVSQVTSTIVRWLLA